MEQESFRELKRLEKTVSRLDRDLDSVIVEGPGDRNVMERLGFTGKIFLSAERTLEDLVEDVSRGSNRVGILTDFDEHGKEENEKISQALQQKVDVIKSSREEFGIQLTSEGRRTLEEIEPLFSSKQEKFVEATLDRIYFRD